ncbi:UDP-N-acetylmuramate dehydrogenase [Aliidiomarina halalkaliphila]|uniref:UDP-N-acetylenolpyruvoylglucosamine reductase n=1 Tax=Aliidiomarina halalkaliphila TaxID=2593535 RepID=A0A552WYW9_9GAMM|nr:UDP-N-acetylmuramate dehydrogenase [Aliidiomarina halalkaliphila]TRW47987.1 UDP-N-acetylmuramate dehydrogenase [Aliidiomarina halalkaliphila]
MVSLKDKHSFRISASANEVISVTHRDQLSELTNPDELWILGEGTNTIFTEDFQGKILWIQLRGIEVTEHSDAWSLQVAAGENWHQLVEYTLLHGMPGLENLALIPGSVGAAPVQNIGAYGVELSEFIEAVEGYDLKTGEARYLPKDSCGFSYRESVFKTPEFSHFVITDVHLRIPKDWAPTLSYADLADMPSSSTAHEVMQRVITVRRRKLPDPAEIPNAGSFFKNPVVDHTRLKMLQEKYPTMPVYPVDDQSSKIPAGWLIDKAGLKALQVGDAGVHEQQALVLVNRGAASGQELSQLAHQIIAQVHDIYGVKLEPEVRLLNRSGLIPKSHWWQDGA